MPLIVPKKAADIAREVGCNLMVLWLARYLHAEAKDAVRAAHHMLEAVNALLNYDKDLRIAIETKPNEPMDMAYIPTIGHALALGSQVGRPAACRLPGRIGACDPGWVGSFRRDGLRPGI